MGKNGSLEKFRVVKLQLCYNFRSRIRWKKKVSITKTPKSQPFPSHPNIIQFSIFTINITICNHHILPTFYHSFPLPTLSHTSHLLPLYIVIHSTSYPFHNFIILSLLPYHVIIVTICYCYHYLTYMLSIVYCYIMPYCPYIIILYNMYKNRLSKTISIIVNHIYI